MKLLKGGSVVGKVERAAAPASLGGADVRRSGVGTSPARVDESAQMSASSLVERQSGRAAKAVSGLPVTQRQIGRR